MKKLSLWTMIVLKFKKPETFSEFNELKMHIFTANKHEKYLCIKSSILSLDSTNLALKYHKPVQICSEKKTSHGGSHLEKPLAE